MEVYKLEKMTKGWFIGNFEPSVHCTNDVEVGLKNYTSGFCEDSHFHKVAKEFTVIISGSVDMNGQIFNSGDIVVIMPGEMVKFKAISDVTTLVVKIPGVNNDKYLAK